jgi:protein-tyrosine phosphatase
MRWRGASDRGPRQGVRRVIQWIRRRRHRAAVGQLAGLTSIGSGVLVVCTANRVRSPFAAGALLARRPDLLVESRGVLPGGDPCPAASIETAALYGVDLRAHRAQRLDPAELLRAGLILTMDKQVSAMFLRRFPATEGRVFPIGLFDPVAGDALDIPDPYLLPRSEYQDVYARLVRCVDVLARAIPPSRENAHDSFPAA